MKHSSGPRKTANLSESIHRHVNMYALAAGAAGVSVLALAQPAEAKIVYTTTNVKIGPRGVKRYHIDFNHDGITDLTIQYFRQPRPCFLGWGIVQDIDETPAPGDGVEGPPPAALSSGAVIGRSQGFARNRFYMAQVLSGTSACFSRRGNWWDISDRYLGVAFKIAGKRHFGWARLSVGFSFPLRELFATLTGYAYETTPGKAIIAGRTKGPADDPSNEDFGPGASLTSPIPDTPQPASLGMLALGAQGVPLWRRKESVLEGD
jgi:hypothetical protein